MQKLNKQVLERLKFGDESAFNELYTAYMQPAVRFCNSIVKDLEESENIVHDVFIKIWDRRETINPELNFTSYLFTIIRNRVFDFLKEVKRNDQIKEEYWQRIEKAQQEDVSVQEERIQRIGEAVEDLSEKRKQIIKLNYQEGKSYEEIAAEMHISKNTVKNQLVKAKQIIREQLKNAAVF
jgi:RNA polymerase sigma-70 factor (ECF subfamily)